MKWDKRVPKINYFEHLLYSMKPRTSNVTGSELELHDYYDGDCEFCERKAKYTVIVNQVDSITQRSREFITLRCAYHKNSTREHYETEYNSYRRLGND